MFVIDELVGDNVLLVTPQEGRDYRTMKKRNALMTQCYDYVP